MAAQGARLILGVRARRTTQAPMTMVDRNTETAKFRSNDVRCPSSRYKVTLHTATTKCYEQTGMKYPTTLIVAVLLCSTAVAAPEQTTCDSPCDCHDAYGETRWSVKSDVSLPPTDASEIQAVTPSDMFQLARPGRAYNDAIRAHRD
jgi:hypothetical protein